jgi:predicted secreted protein
MNFVKPAKADRNKVSKKEKKYAPQFGRSICRKIFSPIGRTVSEKKGENLVFTPKTGF